MRPGYLLTLGTAEDHMGRPTGTPWWMWLGVWSLVHRSPRFEENLIPHHQAHGLCFALLFQTAVNIYDASHFNPSDLKPDNPGSGTGGLTGQFSGWSLSETVKQAVLHCLEWWMSLQGSMWVLAL